MCTNNCYIFPSEVLKKIIQNSVGKSQYAKFLNKSDPKVYGMNNYDLNSVQNTGAHKCLGTEFSVYFKNKANKEIILHDFVLEDLVG